MSPPPPERRCECGGMTRVYETRGWFRRRECLRCGSRFRTLEKVYGPKKPPITRGHGLDNPST